MLNLAYLSLAQSNMNIVVEHSEDRGVNVSILKYADGRADSLKGYAFHVKLVDYLIVDNNTICYLLKSPPYERYTFSVMKRDSDKKWKEVVNNFWSTDMRKYSDHKILSIDKIERTYPDGHKDFVDLIQISAFLDFQRKVTPETFEKLHQEYQDKYGK